MRHRMILAAGWVAASCLIVVVKGAPALGAANQNPPVVPQATAGAVTVPEGNGTPVITDGQFSPGEWDDSLRIALTGSTELRLKQYRGVVFIGVHGSTDNGVGPSGLYLAEPGGAIHNLHVSAQLGEIVIPPAGNPPPFRFGLTTGWYANELRRDMQKAAILEKEGKSPMDIIMSTSYPSDGIEFAIRRSKLPAPVWLLRLAASVIDGGKPGWLVYPAATAERTTEGWLELRLK